MIRGSGCIFGSRLSHHWLRMCRDADMSPEKMQEQFNQMGMDPSEMVRFWGVFLTVSLSLLPPRPRSLETSLVRPGGL